MVKPTCGMRINTNMALLECFKKSSFLPNPNESLSERMPSSSIASANREVQNVINDENLGSKRGQYANYSDDESSEASVPDESYNSLLFFKKEFADRPLKESTGLHISASPTYGVHILL